MTSPAAEARIHLFGFSQFECHQCKRKTELFAVLVSAENYDLKTGKNKKKKDAPFFFFCPTCYEDFKATKKRWKKTDWNEWK
jgi:hypothetical protein